MITIASPNTDRSLLTLAELRAAAGVSDGSKDAILTPLGNYISAVITKACKVAKAGEIPPTLRLETVTETFRLAAEQRNLVLARRPVVEIASLSQSETTIDASGYMLEAAAGILYKLSGAATANWPVGALVIEYSAGWEAVPDDLKYAAIKFVQAELTAGSRDPYLKRLRIDGVSEREWWVEPSKDTVDTTIPPDVMTILRQGGYINMVIV